MKPHHAVAGPLLEGSSTTPTRRYLRKQQQQQQQSRRPRHHHHQQQQQQRQQHQFQTLRMWVLLSLSMILFVPEHSGCVGAGVDPIASLVTNKQDGEPRRRVLRGGGGGGSSRGVTPERPRRGRRTIADGADASSRPPNELFKFYAQSVSGDRTTSLCGGTLVAPDVILTAAQCVEEGVWNRGGKVSVGAFSFSVGDGTAGGQVREIVVDPIVHPDFSVVDETAVASKSLRPNDLAIIKIQPIILSELTKPIRINIDATEDPFVSDTLRIAGFGIIDAGAQSPSPSLQYGDVISLGTDICQAKYKELVSECLREGFKSEEECNAMALSSDDLERILCGVGLNGVERPMTGDIGGPLFDIIGTGGRPNDPLQVGVISHVATGTAGATRGAYPHVYTRISHYKDWLRENVCTLTDTPDQIRYLCKDFVRPSDNNNDAVVDDTESAMTPTEEPTVGPESSFSSTLTDDVDTDTDADSTTNPPKPTCIARGKACTQTSDCCGDDKCNRFDPEAPKPKCHRPDWIPGSGRGGGPNKQDRNGGGGGSTGTGTGGSASRCTRKGLKCATGSDCCGNLVCTKWDTDARYPKCHDPVADGRYWQRQKQKQQTKSNPSSAGAASTSGTKSTNGQKNQNQQRTNEPRKKKESLASRFKHLIWVTP